MLAYARFNYLPVDWQGNDIAAVGCWLSVNVEISYRTVLTRQYNLMIMTHDLPRDL
jgi:hypothetical protein